MSTPTEAELEAHLARVKTCIDDVLARLQREALESHPASVLTALEVVVALTLSAGLVPVEVFFEGVKHAGCRILGHEPPPQTAACIHCKQEVALVTDVDAIRHHSMTCEKSPVVEEVQRLRRIEEAAYHVAWRWENRDVAQIEGTRPEQLDELARAFANCGCPNCGRPHLEPYATDDTGRDHGPFGCPDCAWTVGDPIKSRGELLDRIEDLEIQVREQEPDDSERDYDPDEDRSPDSEQHAEDIEF